MAFDFIARTCSEPYTRVTSTHLQPSDSSLQTCMSVCRHNSELSAVRHHLGGGAPSSQTFGHVGAFGAPPTAGSMPAEQPAGLPWHSRPAGCKFQQPFGAASSAPGEDGAAPVFGAASLKVNTRIIGQAFLLYLLGYLFKAAS